MSCDTIKLIQKQFLCNYPLTEFIWKDLFDNLDEVLQIELVKHTVDLVLQYPVKVSYQVAFLKHIIRRLEDTGSEIADVLYESLCRLTTQESSNVCYKYYIVGNTGHVVTLKENTSFISNGTTGLQTWQAAVVLAEYIAQHSDQFSDKSVLELGSGMGLPGLVLHKVSSPKAVNLSDCHPMVLQILCENVKVNIEEPYSNTLETKDSALTDWLEYATEKGTVRVLDLPWEEISPEFCKLLGKMDIVLAADIVYDSSTFTHLLSALGNLYKYSAVDEFILACTVRNEQTLNEFLRLVVENQLNVTEVDVPSQENFIWSNETNIKLYSIKKK